MVVTGVGDGVVDGTQVTSVTFDVDPASDARYVGLSPVSVSTTDAEAPGFTLTQTGGSTVVDERGASDTLLVVLDAQPLSDVVLSITSGDVGEVASDSATLTFTPANWSTAKVVAVSGVSDGTTVVRGTPVRWCQRR